MARPERRRRRRPAAGLTLTLALAASSACACAGAGISAGPTAAPARLFGWGDDRRSERLRCPDAVSAAVDAALVGPHGEATRAAEWLARCRADTKFRFSKTPLDAQGTRQVCAAPTCVAWFVAVADAQLPACEYRGQVDLRALAETFLVVCDGLGAGGPNEAPDADAFAHIYSLHTLLDTTDEPHAARDASTRPVEVSALVATARRRLQQASELDSGAGDDSGLDSESASTSTSGGSDSGSGGSGSSLQELGTGSTLAGIEDSSSTSRSSASELAMSYLYICLILALFNCSYLFFMRKT